MFDTAKPFLLSLALGLVLGIERERAFAQGRHLAMGSRTFALIALLGTLAAHLGSPVVAVVLAAFVAAIVVAVYVRTGEDAGHPAGATTEVAAVVTFALGWLCHEDVLLAAMLGVVVLAVLWLKPGIHRFAHEGLNDQEAKAALTFLVIALVVLPLLPNRTVDPWDLFNPSRLWLLFVLIAGVGFSGYIAVRALGPARGLAAAGFAAGLVSSTAATLSLSRKAREDETFAGPLAVAIVLANVASALAQILVVAVANPNLVREAAVLVGAPVLVGTVGAAAAHAWLSKGKPASAEGTSFRLSNPLELKPALAMAGIFAVILVVAALATSVMGSSGIVATAAIAGINDVHAASLAAATLAAAGQVTTETALLAILVAFLVNMGVKLGITAVAGGRRLLAMVAPPLLAMVVAAIAAFAILERSAR